jgi:hypothetical protein
VTDEYVKNENVLIYDELHKGYREAVVLVDSHPDNNKVLVKISRIRESVRVRRELVRRPGPYEVSVVGE